MNIQLLLGVVVMITLATTIGVTPILVQLQSAAAATAGKVFAPTAVSEDNVYVAWWGNKTGNDEVLFRASTDGGKTFGDKINLSNSTNADSEDVEIAADGTNVVVTWWERNQTANEPVMKTSNDGGQTFGPLIKLATNGTIGTGEVKPIL